MGCSSDSLRYHRKHSATGVLLRLSRDRGGIFRSGHLVHPSEEHCKEKQINRNKCGGLSRDWVGGKILFMCFLGGHS